MGAQVDYFYADGIVVSNLRMEFSV